MDLSPKHRPNGASGQAQQRALCCRPNMVHIINLTLCLWVIIFPVFQTANGQTTPSIIGEIIILGNERTDIEIIRRELLFAKGDLLDLTLIAETERNLRSLFFIGEVDIDLVDNHGSVEVIVEVEDLHSRALSPLISGPVDELNFGLIGFDYNLFGRGQILRLALENRALSGPKADLLIIEPRLRGSRQRLGIRLGFGAEGHDHALSISRPFATLADERSFGLTLSSQESVQRLYTQGQLDHRYRTKITRSRIWLTQSYGNQTKIRPSIELGFTDRQSTPSEGFSYAPLDKTRIIPSLGLLVWHPDFSRDRFIRNLGPLEDLQTGPWFSLRWGFAHRELGSDRSYSFYQAQFAPHFKPTEHSYTLLTFIASTRIDHGGFYNVIALSTFKAYARIGEAHSLALRISWEALHKSEDTTQLLLGLNRGLRGFAPRTFDGTRRLLVNLAIRPTLKRHSWYTLAGAAFIDCGTAWTPNRKRPQLALSPGLGIRIGLPKVYNTPVLRCDIASGIRTRNWRLSVGLGQYF